MGEDYHIYVEDRLILVFNNLMILEKCPVYPLLFSPIYIYIYIYIYIKYIRKSYKYYL